MEQTKKKLWRSHGNHSKLCTWDGTSSRVTQGVGNCRACDEIKAVRSNSYEPRGKYGIEKDGVHMFCRSKIPWGRCTKHTNPSCACGKLVMNATA